MSQQAYVIVLGNEKGGTGKSTTAMHVVSALTHLGFRVASIDVDARQGTLTRYVENRKKYCQQHKKDLPMSDHTALVGAEEDTVAQANQKEAEDFKKLFETLRPTYDFIVMDTPGHNSHLSRFVHSYADTLITPLNDSFIDLDVLAHINPETLSLERPSIYANSVWEHKKNKACRDQRSMDWIVLRNRLSSINAHNKQKMEGVLSTLAKRLAFRTLQGFSERVIFRELFLQGLTLLDLKKVGMPLQLYHVAARQELRDLLGAIQSEMLQARLKATNI